MRFSFPVCPDLPSIAHLRPLYTEYISSAKIGEKGKSGQMSAVNGSKNPEFLLPEDVILDRQTVFIILKVYLRLKPLYVQTQVC